MTEVPDHLLERSRARRAALGLGGGDAPAAPPSAAGTEVEAAGDASPAPAAAASAAVVEAAPVAPQPVAPNVQASLSRPRVPVWAMPVIAFLPLWAVLYAQTLSQPPSKEPNQLEAGAALYGQCAGCHGGSGGGGAGRQLSDGEVLATFPNIAHQLEFVNIGSAGFEGKPYGDPNRAGGARNGLSFGRMPAFKGKLTDAELLEVVRHERETLGGETDGVTVDEKGQRLWPNGKPMLDDAGKLVWDDGTPMFDAEGKLSKPADPSVAPAK